MALPSKFLKRLGRRAVDRVVARVGGKLVSGMADTSADAPASRFEPKRQVYDEWRRQSDAGSDGSGSGDGS